MRCSSQLVSASAVEGGVGVNGDHSSVLVHRVKDWLGNHMARAGSDRGKPVLPRPEELFLDQRRYANISRYVSTASKWTGNSCPLVHR